MSHNFLGGSRSYTDCGGGSLPLCIFVHVVSMPKGAVFYTLVPHTQRHCVISISLFFYVLGSVQD